MTIKLDADLADLYQVETRRLNEAVKRNIDRFPPEFMFQLTRTEYDNLMSQFVTSSFMSQIVCLLDNPIRNPAVVTSPSVKF
jgi:hypothetical protein